VQSALCIDCSKVAILSPRHVIYTSKGRLLLLDHSHHYRTNYRLCDLHDRHAMVTETLRSLHREGANYIFKNNRLLIGWLAHVFEDQKTEVWLAKPPPSNTTGKACETTGWRIYSSSDGSELLSNLTELHPALLVYLVGENSEEFLSRSQKERLSFLSERYEDVVRGRYKHSESEGGELKAMASDIIFPRYGVSNARKGEEQKEGKRKRKSGSDCPELPEYENVRDKKRRLETCESDDDEERPPSMKTEEPIEMDAMDLTPTALEPASQNLQQHTPAQTQPHDQISASIANLDIADQRIPGDYKPAGQEDAIREPVKPEPMALNPLAKTLRDIMIGQVMKWAICDSGLKNALESPAGELCVAENEDEIVIASRKILQRLNGFHAQNEELRSAEQKYLQVLRTSTISVNTLRVHESSILKREGMEKKLKGVIEEMTQRIAELQTGMM